MHRFPPSPAPASSVRPSRLRAGRGVWALLALWLPLYASFALFTPPLLDDADSVHAEAAREMLIRHDWITLHANGIRYLEKAPLLYWSMAASFRIFGPHAWAARLPVALSALALFLAVYGFGRSLFAFDIAGFYSALILLTSFGVFIYSRIMLPDTMVCLWLTLSLWLFWLSLEEPQPTRRTTWGFAVCCGLNVLTKGLIGIVFPAAIVLVYLFLTRNLGHLRRCRPVSSLLVFLAVAVPWHLAAGIANPAQGNPSGAMPTPGNVHGFFWFFFVNEQFLRYLNLRVPRDYDTVSLPLFWGLILVWLMPWSAFLFMALEPIRIRSSLRRASLARPDQARTLLGVWAAVVMIFFSFSTRQEYYSLPALPALALLIGGWLTDEERAARFDDRSNPLCLAGRRIALALLLLGWAGAALALTLAVRAVPPAPGADISALLRQNPGDYALSMGHFLDLTGRAMGAFRLPLCIAAISLAVGTLANLLLRRKGRIRRANLALGAMAGAFLVAAHMALVTFSPALSSKALADAIHPLLRPGDLVEINGEYESGSTLGFYLRRQVRILNGRSSNLWYGSFFNDAPHIFDDTASFRRLWAGPQRIFLWTEPDRIPSLPGKVFVIASSGGKEIVSNRGR